MVIWVDGGLKQRHNRLYLLGLNSHHPLEGCDTAPGMIVPTLIGLLVLPFTLFAQDSTLDRDWAEVGVPFVKKHCIACHQGPKAKGGVSLEKLVGSMKESTKQVELWSQVAEQVRTKAMPPEGKPRPTVKEQDSVNTWIDQKILKLACAGPGSPGKVAARRLNRAEYANTIRDLLGLTGGNPSEDLPADDVGYGFDNIADVLTVSPLHLEKYLGAAEKFVDQALSSPVSRTLLKLPHPSAIKMEGLEGYIRPFVERAYRRQISDSEFKKYIALARQIGEESKDPVQGLAAAYQATLISPYFLFRIEPDPVSPETFRDLNSFELATRLSYFLWSSMPDAELFSLAKTDELKKSEVLENQVKRMMKDKKSEAFVVNFAGQWLNLRNLDIAQPDTARFRRFNDPLRYSMKRETEMFISHVVREDKSILDLLDSNYTFLNQALAAHYGLPKVIGTEMRKVDLNSGERGGVLTHASVLTLTSNPTRTNPVKRGKWILEVLLGTPPPPPPPGVEELKDDKKAQLSGTLRQRMEQHRSNPNCAVCHQKLDPLGFGLENYDAVGAWRTKENDQKIDSSGVLPGGEKFDGPKELKSILLQKKDLFTRNLADRLLTYALGRGMENADRCVVDKIAENAKLGDYKMSVLILEVVRTEAFRSKSTRRITGGVS